MSSMKGSLMPFENNNEVGSSGKGGKGAGVGSKSSPPPRIVPRPSSSSSKRHTRVHLNSLWSAWYGLSAAALQAYLAVQGARRLLGYAELPWTEPPPRVELHAALALTGAAALLLPFFLAAAVLKVGNLANDGFKLGRHLSACSADPPGALPLAGPGTLRSLWQHGGPTAPFLHLAAAFCLLLPKLLMEARLIQAGFLPKDAIWRTDLDFMVVHRDRLVVLSFMASVPAAAASNTSLNFLPSPHASSAVTPTPSEMLTATTLSMANATNATTSAADVASMSTARTLPFRGLQDLVTPEIAQADGQEWGPVSAEYLNYALALLVYAVRYPAVFWNTNKCFGALFSFQLLANGLQSLLAYAGMCVLYKVQVFGVTEALPMLPHRMSGMVEGESPFLLNTHVTLALFVLSNVLVLASSLVLYLYGYGRFNAFLNQERERRIIILNEGRPSRGWGYFTHCAALCVLLAIAVCNAPLLYDYTVVYRGSLDGAILACVIGGILHLFLWVVVWLLLTVKQHWVFKLRVTIGRAAVKSARSVKLVTDVDLISSRHSTDDSSSSTPLLVVGNGRTYTIADTSPKKAIMSVIQKAALERKARTGQSGSGISADDGEEQIYWLRPKPPSPKTSPDSSDRLTWLNRKLSGNTGTKHKVTFDDSLATSTSRKGKGILAKSPRCNGKNKGKTQHQQRGGLDHLSESEEDDGDYATLRELPAADNSEDNLSEENKCIHERDRWKIMV